MREGALQGAAHMSRSRRASLEAVVITLASQGTICLPFSSMTINASTGQTLHASISRSRSMSGGASLNAQMFSLSNSKTSGATFMQFEVLMQSKRSMRTVR